MYDPAILKDEYMKVKSKWICSRCSQQVGGGSGGESTDKPVVDKRTAADKKTVVDKNVVPSDITLADIMTEMLSFRKEVVKTNQDFSESMNRYSEWVEENTKRLMKLQKSSLM